MSNDSCDLPREVRSALGDLPAEVWGRGEGCPSARTLAAYGAGRLSRAATARLQEHLQQCPACAVAALPPFDAVPHAAPAMVWPRLLPRLAAAMAVLLIGFGGGRWSRAPELLGPTRGVMGDPEAGSLSGLSSADLLERALAPDDEHLDAALDVLRTFLARHPMDAAAWTKYADLLTRAAARESDPAVRQRLDEELRRARAEALRLLAATERTEP